MKTKKKPSKKQRDLLRIWKRRTAFYMQAALTSEKGSPERQRYEGIATGSRWCAEDLSKGYAVCED